MKKYSISIWMVLICLLLTACNLSKDNKTDKKEQVDLWATTDNSSAVCQDGIVYQKNSLLHFADFKSGESVVLCNKPNFSCI